MNIMLCHYNNWNCHAKTAGSGHDSSDALAHCLPINTELFWIKFNKSHQFSIWTNEWIFNIILIKII